MNKPSLKDRLAAGVAQPDKFAAADQAMSAGALSPSSAYTVPPPAVKVEEQKPVVPHPVAAEELATAIKPFNSGFVKGARVTKKIPKGESVIIRETFSLPPGDSACIDALRLRAAKSGVMLNRSEIIRAGIAALAMLNETQFADVTNEVPKLKTGRPTA